MFDNIGGKIKMVAKVSCWIGIIASVILGIIFLAESDNELIGLLFIILGPLCFWLGSFITYGFGELIENSAKLVEFNTIKNNRPARQTNEQKANQLKQLKEKGLITEEEFIAKIRELQGGTNE